MIIGNPITLGGGGGGGGSVLIDKTINAAGVYNASDDNADGYKKVIASFPLGTKNISTNGTFPASAEDLAGFSTVVVSVPQTISGGRCPRTEQTANFQYGALLADMSWDGEAVGQNI